MSDLFYDILNHLKDKPADNDIDITAFIKELDYTITDTTEGTISILKTLGDLQQKHLVISSVTNSMGQTYKSEELTYKHLREVERTKTFNDLKAVVNITTDGKNYLSEKLRQERQDFLLERQTIINEESGRSVIDTNEFSKTVARKNILILWITAGVAFAGALASILTWYSTSEQEQQKKLIKQQDSSIQMLRNKLIEKDDTLSGQKTILDSLKNS